MEQVAKVDEFFGKCTVAMAENYDSIKGALNGAAEKGNEKWNKFIAGINALLAKIPTKEELVATGKDLGEFLKKLGIEAAKGLGAVALFGLGLIVGSFILAFKSVKFVYKLGESFIETVSTTASQTWEKIGESAAIFTTAVKQGTQTAYAQTVKKESVRNVLSFDDFLKRG